MKEIKKREKYFIFRQPFLIKIIIWMNSHHSSEWIDYFIFNTVKDENISYMLTFLHSLLALQRKESDKFKSTNTGGREKREGCKLESSEVIMYIYMYILYTVYRPSWYMKAYHPIMVQSHAHVTCTSNIMSI